MIEILVGLVITKQRISRTRKFFFFMVKYN